MKNTRQETKAQPYAVVAFRPGTAMRRRMNALAKRSGMSPGQILARCIEAQLPAIEARHAKGDMKTITERQGQTGSRAFQNVGHKCKGCRICRDDSEENLRLRPLSAKTLQMIALQLERRSKSIRAYASCQLRTGEQRMAR